MFDYLRVAPCKMVPKGGSPEDAQEALAVYYDKQPIVSVLDLSGNPAVYEDIADFLEGIVKHLDLIIKSYEDDQIQLLPNPSAVNLSSERIHFSRKCNGWEEYFLEAFPYMISRSGQRNLNISVLRGINSLPDYHEVYNFVSWCKAHAN